MSHLASLTSASSSVEEENNTPLAFWSVMTYQCLKHCQFQSGEIHENTEAGHKFHSLCCVFLPRDVSTTGISLISFFEVVCQKAFQFSRDCLCVLWSMPEHICKAKCIFQVISDHRASTKHIASVHIKPLHYQAYGGLWLPKSREGIMNPVQSPWRNRGIGWWDPTDRVRGWMQLKTLSSPYAICPAVWLYLHSWWELVSPGLEVV